MIKSYITLANGRQLHMRRTGQGTPVIMLHPSPLSSAFFEPLMNYLGDGFELIAFDTPGYGDSDALENPGDDLSAYVQVMHEAIVLLGLPKLLVYGSATGAQLAIELAKHCPDLIAGLVLENAAAFTDSERGNMLPEYFPDLCPEDDGSHLKLIWRMAKQTYQYFPWYDCSESARISEQEPPTALVEATVKSYLRAGPDYARAYKAAFANERPEQLAAVTVPSQVLLWQDSPLLTYSKRLQQAQGMPENISFIDVGSGMDVRYQAVRHALTALDTL